jgi:outer membrane protein assembly factor BamE
MKTILRHFSQWAVLVTVCTLLGGCFIKPYKFDLYQGNILSPDKVAQIQPGMSREQVRYVLGTPMLNDVFETERWDYVYLEKRGYKNETRRHLAVFFDEGRVARVTHDPLPDVADVDVA